MDKEKVRKGFIERKGLCECPKGKSCPRPNGRACQRRTARYKRGK